MLFRPHKFNGRSGETAHIGLAFGCGPPSADLADREVPQLGDEMLIVRGCPDLGSSTEEL